MLVDLATVQILQLKRLFDQMMVNAQGSGPKCAALMENIVSKSGLKFMYDDQSLRVTLSRDHSSCGEGPSYGEVLLPGMDLDWILDWTGMECIFPMILQFIIECATLVTACTWLELW